MKVFGIICKRKSSEHEIQAAISGNDTMCSHTNIDPLSDLADDDILHLGGEQEIHGRVP